MKTKTSLRDFLNPNGIELKGSEITKYAKNILKHMHRIGEDQQIKQNNIKNITQAIEYLKLWLWGDVNG